MRDSSRVLTNSFFLMLKEGFHAIVSICVVAILARYFSIEKFGDYAFILALCNIFQVTTDMGVNRAGFGIRKLAVIKDLLGYLFRKSAGLLSLLLPYFQCSILLLPGLTGSYTLPPQTILPGCCLMASRKTSMNRSERITESQSRKSR